MPDLFLSGRPVRTVFDLLGRSENDMTHALGWGLGRSDTLRRGLLARLGIEGAQGEVTVRLQQQDALGGYTDIEIGDGASFHVIIEAKRGWWLPSRDQLERYARRFTTMSAPDQRLVVLTQWGAESAARHEIGRLELSAPCEVLGWSDVLTLVRRARADGGRAARAWLDELERYLKEVTDMRDIDSNSVYVVSLGRQRPDGWPHDSLEVVTRLGRYFFPASGKNWPKVPPNYIAFRFGGRLQSIHHVDGYVIATEMSEVLPVPRTRWDPHYVLTLGPAIRPAEPAPTGPRIRRAARVWVDIDLLLTSPTISDALTQTQHRRGDG